MGIAMLDSGLWSKLYTSRMNTNSTSYLKRTATKRANEQRHGRGEIDICKRHRNTLQ